MVEAGDWQHSAMFNLEREKARSSYMQRELNQYLSGNEVYYTACSSLVISKNWFSEPHRQKDFISILF